MSINKVLLEHRQQPFVSVLSVAAFAVTKAELNSCDCMACKV